MFLLEKESVNYPSDVFIFTFINKPQILVKVSHNTSIIR